MKILVHPHHISQVSQYQLHGLDKHPGKNGPCTLSIYSAVSGKLVAFRACTILARVSLKSNIP